MNNNPAKRSKSAGFAFLLISIFALLVILHRVGCYFYEFDSEFAPYDYGRFNFFSYFTVQSNIFVLVYLFFVSLSFLGFIKADLISYNPYVTVFVTVYIIITGLVYCCGIPLGFTPPFVWDTPVHSMSSFIQVFHHMVIPPLVLILLFLRRGYKLFKVKYLPLVGVYPLIYSIISIIRGKFSNPHFYAYPFYNPEFVYSFLGKTDGISTNVIENKGYALMCVLLVAGISMFIGMGALITLIYNKRMVGDKK